MLRWSLWIGTALAFLWLVYCVSPYVALYRFERAVQAHDAAAVQRRVNLRALRFSLTKQVANAVVEAGARGHQLDAQNRQMAVGAAIAIAEPLVARLLTPETIIDLLDDGWPQDLAPDGAPTMGGLQIRSPSQVWRFFTRSEGRGFRNVVVTFPPRARPEAQFRLKLRLGGWTWRITEIELPTVLRERLVRELAERGSERPFLKP